MPKNFSQCLGCPYCNQAHLNGTQYYTSNNVPLDIEQNNSKTLLVFEAPGEDEWINKVPISSQKIHSCSYRMKQSFTRKVVNRFDYDITEIVQCYPGKNLNKRDKKPVKQAINCCSKYLLNDILNNNYTTIVCFGVIASNTVNKIINDYNKNNYNKITANVKLAFHPSGDVSNLTLDNSY